MALGVLAAMLPARWWPSLDQHVPATSAAAAAGIVTFIVAMAIGIPGFLAHLEESAAAHNAAAVAVFDKGKAGDKEGTVLRQAPMIMSGLALPIFLFATPLGWLTLYLGISGMLRALAGFIEAGFGDPILTGLDKLAVGTRRRLGAGAARVRRESLEGPELPDRIMNAQQLGIANADFVIVASRRKPDWDKGTVVQTPDGTAYRVGEIEDRTIGGRLRTLYPLTEHKDLEVFRRVVHYDLPPGRR